jgi:hypothetical protein
MVLDAQTVLYLQTKIYYIYVQGERKIYVDNNTLMRNQILTKQNGK